MTDYSKIENLTPSNSVEWWLAYIAEHSGSKDLPIYICKLGEYNPTTGVPTISEPSTKLIYLVPTGKSDDLYAEWIWTDGAWNPFGSVRVDLSQYVLKTTTINGKALTDDISLTAADVGAVPTTAVGAAGGVAGYDATQTALNGKQNVLTFDSTPTANSRNPVTSQGIKSYVDKTDTTLDARITALENDALDGTVATYRKIMKRWFLAHGAETASPAELTALCDEWYSLHRNGWTGYSEFDQPDYTETGDTGVKKGDNAGLVCEPSTDTVAGRDDYAGLPQFAVTDCNWVLDADGNIIITAIDGITSSFERYNPEKFVGVLQMSMWHFWGDDNENHVYYHGVTDTYTTEYANITPYPESVRIDGTIRPWVCHGKYLSKTVNGKMTCCAGNIPTAFTSHNTLVTLPDNIGPQYSGGTLVDWSFLFLMTMVKYASITLDNNIQSCVNHSYQYYAAVSETGVERVILTTSQAANLPVGSSVIIGVYNGSSADRGTAANFSITGNGGAVITAKETVTIEGTEYVAIYVDTADTFDTTANGTATAGSTIISTWHWRTGTNDDILGNDGTIVNSKTGKYPAKLQGIEFAMGGYEVDADTILNLDGSVYRPYIAKRTVHQGTSINANMVASTLSSPQPETDSWNYIRRNEYDGTTGIFFQTDTTGGSSAKYTKDGFYKNKAGTTGTREVLSFGNLYSGTGFGGLSYLGGGNGLGLGAWLCLARLSPNGSRGVVA